jgi:hypothetical protein
MKKALLTFLAVVFALTLCASVIPAKAADVYPDLLEATFGEDGAAFNFVTGSDLEKNDPDKTPITVYDEKAQAYFLRTSTSDPTNYFISKEATNIIKSKYNTKQADPDSELDPSFTWEFLVRVPEMPKAMRYGSGYYASGGLSFTADANNGYFKICSGTSDSNAKDYYLKFAMEANKWYHCVLIYDDPGQQFYAYVNGERITTADGADHVDVNPFRFSYLWHWGMTVGGGNIEDKKVVISQDIAIYNVYSHIISEDDVIDLYYDADEMWGIDSQSAPTPTQKVTPNPTATPEITQAPTATPEVTQEPAVTQEVTQEPSVTTEPTQEPAVTSEPVPTSPADITNAPTDSSAKTPAGEATSTVDNTPIPATPTAGTKQNDSSKAVLIVAIVAAALVIAGGVAAGIVVAKKKK